MTIFTLTLIYEIALNKITEYLRKCNYKMSHSQCRFDSILKDTQCFRQYLSANPIQQFLQLSKTDSTIIRNWPAVLKWKSSKRLNKLSFCICLISTNIVLWLYDKSVRKTPIVSIELFLVLKHRITIWTRLFFILWWINVMIFIIHSSCSFRPMDTSSGFLILPVTLTGRIRCL